jgi:hypothetical protein
VLILGSALLGFVIALTLGGSEFAALAPAVAFLGAASAGLLSGGSPDRRFVLSAAAGALGLALFYGLVFAMILAAWSHV